MLLHRLRGTAIVAVLTVVVLLAGIYLWTRSVTYERADEVPAMPVALVFGAGVMPDGSPTPMLAGRVDRAAELYRAGRAAKLLMSGDNSRPDYDEVGTMRDRALALGVPPEAIVLDHAGFSTYESCYRARAIFGVERAVLVTQRYHLPRALYVCHGLGIDVVGLGDDDWGVYGSERVARYTARELPALFKALWQVQVTRPAPTFLGPPEPMR